MNARVQAAEYIGKGIGDFAKSIGAEEEAFKNMLSTVSWAALWPAGSYVTNKVVDNTMQDASPEAQYAAKVAGSLAAATPVLFRPWNKSQGLVGQAIEYYKADDEKADFLMTALTIALGGTGLFLKKTAKVDPVVPTPEDTPEQKQQTAQKPFKTRTGTQGSKDSGEPEHAFELSAATLAGIFGIAKGVEGSISANAEKEMKPWIDMKEKLEEAEHEVIDHRGEISTVESEALKEGQHIVLKPGDTIPADSTITEVLHKSGSKQLSGDIHLEDSLAQFNGEAAGKRAITVGKEAEGAIGKAAQSMKIPEKTGIKQIIARVERTVEESQFFEMAEKLTSEEVGTHATKVSEFVADKYIPFLLGAVALQFGWAYHQNRKKQVEKIEERREQLRETIANPESDNQQIADQATQLWATTDSHGRDHSARQSLKRTAELAIKMAPCAVMAALLYTSFTKMGLQKAGVGLHNEDALEIFQKVRKKGIAATDFNGVLTKGDEAFESGSTIFKMAGETAQELKEGVKGWKDSIKSMFDHSYALQAPTDNRIAKGMREHLGQQAETMGVTLDKEFQMGKRLDTAISEHKLYSREIDGATVRSGNINAFKKSGITIPKEVAGTRVAGENRIFTMLEKDGETLWKATRMKQGPLREGTVAQIKRYIENDTYVPIISGSAEADIGSRFEELKTALIKAGVPVEKVASHLELHAGVPWTEKGNVLKKYAERIAKNTERDIKDISITATVDGANDTNFIEMTQGELDGAVAALGDTGSPLIRNKADAVIRDISDIEILGELAKPFKNITSGLVAGAAAWMVALVGHHALAEVGVTEQDKQPSTVKSSILHEAPTAIAAGLSAFLAVGAAKKFGPEATSKVRELLGGAGEAVAGAARA